MSINIQQRGCKIRVKTSARFIIKTKQKINCHRMIKAAKIYIWHPALYIKKKKKQSEAKNLNYI